MSNNNNNEPIPSPFTEEVQKSVKKRKQDEKKLIGFAEEVYKEIFGVEMSPEEKEKLKRETEELKHIGEFLGSAEDYMENPKAEGIKRVESKDLEAFLGMHNAKSGILIMFSDDLSKISLSSKNIPQEELSVLLERIVNLIKRDNK